MATSTKRKAGCSKSRRGPSQATQDRQAEVELMAAAVNDEAPDYAAFLARWLPLGIYSETNLQRLFVQCPAARPRLHKGGTWRAMGRQVRPGEKAIWLRIKHTSRDEDKITPDNPDGEVFHGAPWCALFDISQTGEVGEEWTEPAPAGANPADLAEVKRLRAEAMKLHPDTTGDNSQEAGRAFSAAWSLYEAARARLNGQQERRSR
jgi:hypothetical protein